MHSGNDQSVWVSCIDAARQRDSDLLILANWMGTSVQCVIYRGKPLDSSVAVRISHRIPSNVIGQWGARRKVQPVRCQRKIRIKYTRPTISGKWNRNRMGESTIKLQSLLSSHTRALTTNNILMIPIGVFTGLRSQWSGTPHGADVWFMYCR